MSCLIDTETPGGEANCTMTGLYPGQFRKLASEKREQMDLGADCAGLCSVAQSCPTLPPMACSPPVSSTHGILQARILQWVAMPSSRDLPDPEIEPGSSAWQADSLPLSPRGSPELNINCASNRQGLMLLRPPMTDLKMTSELTALFLHGAPSFFLPMGGEPTLRQMSTPPPPPAAGI